MTKTKKIIIGTLISIVTVGGFITYASPGGSCDKVGGMNEKRAEFIMNRISKKLDLNTVQKQNLVALKDTIKAQKEIHKAVSPREEIMKLLSAPVLDETKVLAMMEERTTRLHLAAPTVVTAIANFTNSLSDMQRKELIEVADRIAKRRGKPPFGQHFEAQ